MSYGLRGWLLDGDPSSRLNTIEKVSKHRRICTLCGTGEISSSQTNSHKAGRKHQWKWNEFKMMKSIHCRFRNLNNSMIEYNINHEAWKNHLKSLLFDYVVKGEGSLQSVREHLGRYRYMEKLSLLELALWKCKMVGEVRGNDDPGSMQNSSFRQDSRKNCDAQIIVPLVMGFITQNTHDV